MLDTLIKIQDSIVKTSSTVNEQAVDKINNLGWLESLFTNNPGLVTIFITGFLFPLTFLIITNRNNRKNKKIEKDIEADFQSKEDIRGQEKAVYAALSKILFDVQQLYVSLSGTCVDKNCINDAVKKFDTSMAKYHEEISNNMLYMSSRTISDIYNFYGKIGDLKVELKEYNDKEKYEMAHVLVYMFSSELAEILIELQERLIQKQTSLKIEFDKSQQEMMKYCCGSKPPKEQFDRYLELKLELHPHTSNEEIAMMKSRWEN